MQGKLVAVDLNRLVIDVGGVGLGVVVSKRIINSYANRIDQPVKLWTFLKLTDDEMILFGFTSQAEVGFFCQLISVSGVGPRSALSVMDLGEMEMVSEAIDQARVDFITKAVGIGKKTAQRIIVELKGKLVMEDEVSLDKEVIEALRTLGFKKSEYQDLVALLPEEIKTVEEKVSWLLKKLGR
ncbi:MAG: Holliday junction branch migration protein RuvA [Patescibacteria group bacterium]